MIPTDVGSALLVIFFVIVLGVGVGAALSTRRDEKEPPPFGWMLIAATPVMSEGMQRTAVFPSRVFPTEEAARNARSTFREEVLEALHGERGADRGATEIHVLALRHAKPD